MKTVLVAGTRHKAHVALIKNNILVNAKSVLSIDSISDFLHQNKTLADSILITDGGFSSDLSENIRKILRITDEAKGIGISTVVITHDYYIHKELDRHPGAMVVKTPFMRITENDFNNAFKLMQKATEKATQEQIVEKRAERRAEKRAEKHKSEADDPPLHDDKDDAEAMQDNTPRKRKLFNLGKKRGPQDPEDDNYAGMSRVQNKAVAFTGRAGTGITSTVVNTAYSAAKKGLSVIILDLDIDYRAANLYFDKFCSMAEESEDACRSLIMTLANPLNYTATAVSITNKLWVSSLGYDFDDDRALERFFTGQRITALISGLKSKFDYVFVDIPLRILSDFNESLMCFDTIALCVPNNLHAALTTMRTLIDGFDPDDIRYMNMKTKLIATIYNDESMYDDEIMTPGNLADLITSGICDDFVGELQVIGAVPYATDFNRQIESGIPIGKTNTLLSKAYDEVLTRL